jgi:dTDP-4-dehydrorhamnose 3,5-epimerase
MSRFTLHSTELRDLAIVQRYPLGDKRGYFERMFCSEELGGVLGSRQILQINHSVTAKTGSLRGLHFQHPPHAEMKLVTCLKGEVFDVAVDLRLGSPSFGKYHAEILSEANHKTLVVPEGFAHGFQTLTDDCELLYLHTAAYHPHAEGGVDALDHTLAIAWPRPITERSPRDQALPPLSKNFSGINP